MNTTDWILIGVYVAAFVIEVASLALTANTVFQPNEEEGTVTISYPEGWEAFRGPALIVLGVLVGLAGNITSIFTS